MAWVQEGLLHLEDGTVLTMRNGSSLQRPGQPVISVAYGVCLEQGFSVELVEGQINPDQRQPLVISQGQLACGQLLRGILMGGVVEIPAQLVAGNWLGRRRVRVLDGGLVTVRLDRPSPPGTL